MTAGIEAAKWFGFTNPDRNYLGHAKALSKIERIEQQKKKMPIKTQVYVVLTG